uniref:Band 7 domain-containing protein n=2 Tax=Timema TaxID=61471 RepID=A0A7R9FWI8_TIMSH|nr:unnamed protein product [Timema shepardi]CAD7569699.1 unnamed protein product [Timema californicum]
MAPEREYFDSDKFRAHDFCQVQYLSGTLTVEEVYKDRDQFAALVREVASPDVGRMGIEILSFTIKDVYDEVQYLASLGKSQTAAVKRDADIGVAQANRDAGIREAECEKSAMDIKYNTDTKIEDNSRMYKLQKALFDKEINTAKAEAQLAYELQAAKIRQKIRNEEIQIDVVERRKQIEIEEQEVQRKERELNATVRLPAEAESYHVQMIAEGKRTQTVEVAKADAEKIKKIGAAEAYAIEGVGKAEAERMRMKAAVYKQYGEAAILSLVLDALPKIAAEVAAPLAKTEEIVLLGGDDRTTAEVSRLVGQIPPAMHALTGVDVSKVNKLIHNLYFILRPDANTKHKDIIRLFGPEIVIFKSLWFWWRDKIMYKHVKTFMALLV